MKKGLRRCDAIFIGGLSNDDKTSIGWTPGLSCQRSQQLRHPNFLREALLRKEIKGEPLTGEYMGQSARSPQSSPRLLFEELAAMATLASFCLFLGCAFKVVAFPEPAITPAPKFEIRAVESSIVGYTTGPDSSCEPTAHRIDNRRPNWD